MHPLTQLSSVSCVGVFVASFHYFCSSADEASVDTSPVLLMLQRVYIWRQGQQAHGF